MLRKPISEPSKWYALVMPPTQDERFDRLEALIERGFAALAGDIADTKTEITGVKADVARLREEMQAGFADVRTELKDVRMRIETLELAVQDISGFAKEIDYLLQRVSAIEKHLGIEQKIAA